MTFDYWDFGGPIRWSPGKLKADDYDSVLCNDNHGRKIQGRIFP